MKANKHLNGQTLIEFALIFPLLMFLLIGFFDLGRAVFYYSSLTNAVREAARTGIVKEYGNYVDDADFESQIAQNVLEYGFGLGSLAEEDISVKVDELTEGSEYFKEYIEVTGIFCYEPITPGIISIISSTCDNLDGRKGIELKTVSVMRLEPGTD
jgi:hypothetical protein